jgi:Ca2+-binding EF-hand superfamily protein
MVEKSQAIFSEIIRKVVAEEESRKELREKAVGNFRDFDRFGRGFVTAADLKFYLGKRGVDVRDCECLLFVYCWDWDRDGKLSYAEFANWCKIEMMDEESNSFLTEMIVLSITALREIELIKFQLNSVKEISVIDLFESLVSEENYISAMDLCKLCWGYNIQITEELAGNICRKINKTSEEAVFFFDFAEFCLFNKGYHLAGSGPDPEITPLSMKYSIYKDISADLSERSEIFSRTLERSIFHSVAESTNVNNHITENDLEALRRRLALSSDFTMPEIFRWFADKKGKISRSVFVEKLRKIGVQKEIKMILELYDEIDETKTGGVGIAELGKLLVPMSEGYRLMLKNREQLKVNIGQES